MTKDDYLLLRRAETPKTLRLLELFPDTKRDVRPAAKSRTAFELALTFLGEERINRDLVEGRPAKPAPIANRPSNMAELLAALRETVSNSDAAVEKLSDAEFNRTVNFYGLTLPLSAALMIELLDHIHHRGQFTIYSRIAGARVPQIYGPSGDEP
jgi:uncharacterized damage-inducible protein DinB